MIMSIALNILSKLNFKQSQLCYNSFDNELDNNLLHDLLNEECTSFKTLCDQDVWIFSDASYITRNVDDYFYSNDVTDFEIAHDLLELENDI